MLKKASKTGVLTLNSNRIKNAATYDAFINTTSKNKRKNILVILTILPPRRISISLSLSLRISIRYKYKSVGAGLAPARKKRRGWSLCLPEKTHPQLLSVICYLLSLICYLSLTPVICFILSYSDYSAR